MVATENTDTAIFAMLHFLFLLELVFLQAELLYAEFTYAVTAVGPCKLLVVLNPQKPFLVKLLK